MVACPVEFALHVGWHAQMVLNGIVLAQFGNIEEKLGT